MNKKRVIYILIILIIALVSSVVFTYKKIDNKKTINNHNTLAVMIEQTENQKDYYRSANGEFPNRENDNYKLNKISSYCYKRNEKDDKEWHGYLLQYLAKKIIYKSNIESHCLLYFDVDNVKPKVETVILEKNYDGDEELTPEYTNTNEVRLYFEWIDDDVDYYCIKDNNTISDCKWKQLSLDEKIAQSIDNKKYNLGNDEGEKIIFVFLKDEAGNISETTEKSHKSITYDKTEPNCDILVEGTEGENDWYRSKINIRLTTNDNISGIKEYGLSLNNVETYNNISGPIEINDEINEGSTYHGYVKDKAGNKNRCQKEIKVDRQSPKIDAFYIGGSSNPETVTNRNTKVYIEWKNTDVVAYCVSAINNHSGCTWINGTTSPIIDDYTLTSKEEEKTLYAFIKDRAGNISEVAVDTVTYSLIVPTAELKAYKGSTTNEVATNTWTNESLTFNITGDIEDELGLQDIVYYCEDLENKCTPSIEININTNFTSSLENSGIFYIRYRTRGNNGKYSKMGSYKAKIDKNAPKIDKFYIGDNENQKYLPSATTKAYISWKETSDTSKRSNITHYCLTEKSTGGDCNATSSDWKSVTSTNRTNLFLNNKHTISHGDGKKSVRAYLKDGAGNISEVKISKITLDEGIPVAKIETTNDLKSEKQTATLKCTDDVGVIAYYWGTSSPTNSSTYTNIEMTKNMSINVEVKNAGTYYLVCKGASENKSTKVNMVYYAYTIKNVMEKLTAKQYVKGDYDEESTYKYIALKDTKLLFSEVYTIPEHSNHVKFKGYSLGNPSTTEVKPNYESSPILSENNKTYTMWFWRNRIYMRIHMQNGETLLNGQKTTDTFSKKLNNYILMKKSDETETYRLKEYKYGVSKVNFFDNNPFEIFAITKDRSIPVRKAEWACVSGCASNTTFAEGDMTINDTDELCNTKTEDCNLDLKVNWVTDDKKPECSLRVNLNESPEKIEFADKKDNELRIIEYDITTSNSAPSSYGYGYKNKNSDYASKDLAARTFYGHVKDQAGNIGVCPLTISSITYGWDDGHQDRPATCSTGTPSCNSASDVNNKHMKVTKCQNNPIEDYDSINCTSNNYSSPTTQCSNGYVYISNSCSRTKCPNGGTLDGSKCKYDATVDSYNCVKNATHTCRCGTTGSEWTYGYITCQYSTCADSCNHQRGQDRIDGNCTSYRCSSGETKSGSKCYKYNQSSCSGDWSISNTNYNCPNGGTYNSSSKKCEYNASSSYEYSGTIDCKKTELIRTYQLCISSCPSGTTRIGSTDYCK